MNKNLWVGAAVIVIVIAGYLAVTMQPKEASGEPIKIGFIGPLSGDGAAWGEIEKKAIDLAVEEINANGGANGRPIQVTYEDGKCDGKTALTAAKKLGEIDGIKILLISCSQEILPVAPYAEANKILALTSYASASGISNAGDYIFRNSYTNKDMARSMKDIALPYGKKVAIITEISAFASDLADLFVQEVKATGGTVVAEEGYQQGARDMRTQVTNIIGQKPDVVAINPNGPDTGIATLKQLRALGYKGAIIGNFFGGSKEVQALPEAQGMKYVSDPVFADSAIKRKVFEAYKNKYGGAPDLEWPLGARYDAIYFLKNAFVVVGDDPTKIKDYLYQMPPFTGVLGTYRFDSNGDITNVKPSIAKIENYQSVPAN